VINGEECPDSEVEEQMAALHFNKDRTIDINEFIEGMRESNCE
jgi:Ca2+-binding EF-hand superfamily protein